MPALLAVSAESLNNLRNLLGELRGLTVGGRLGVHAAGVLGTTGAGKGAGILVLLDGGVDLLLGTFRVRQATLGIGGLEEILVADNDANEPVGKIVVSHGPVPKGPVLVRQDDLNEEHVGDGVTDGLVDQVAERGKGGESILLCGGLRLGGLEGSQGVRGEENGAVTVGLEVNTDIEALGDVVKVLDASGSAHDGKLEVGADVVGAGTVGIGGLDNTNAELILQTGALNEVADE